MNWLTDRATRLVLATLVMTGLNAVAAEPEAIPGEFVVKLRTHVSDDKAQLKSIEAALGTSIKSTIPRLDLVVVKRPVFELSKSAIQTLTNNPLVEFAEPNYIYRINKTPNDPMLVDLWGMSNTTTPGVDIGAQAAWDIETGNENLVVAVIDTGLNYNHPDLIDNVWTNEAEANGQPGVDDDANGVIDDIHGYNAITNSGNPLDDHGHGSHCSGTIGAKGDDGKGIVGVAWNVKIMGVKFLSATGSGSLEGAVKAIDYATRMGAKIMSNSWGGGGFSEALKSVIERSNAAGAVFVAAAGNDGSNNDSRPTYPATYDVPNVVAVAAVDNMGRLASFSNYGRTKVHVAAPGVAIKSSTHNGGYDTWSGTSMATPHVSGIVALLASKEPNLTNLEIKERLITTAHRLSSLRGKVASGGMANAFSALMNEVPPPDANDPVNWESTPVAVSSAHPYGNKIFETYSVNVPGAKEISLYFPKFETERGYDTVTIKDSTGKVVEVLSGSMDDTFSAVITGESATIEFKTDDSVNRYGFDITKAAYR